MREVKVRVGLVGAVHPNMPGDDEGLFKKVAAAMEELAAQIGFDLSVYGSPLHSEPALRPNHLAACPREGSDRALVGPRADYERRAPAQLLLRNQHARFDHRELPRRGAHTL